MKRRLLILSDPYSRPSFAPRLRYLCAYLERNGWDIEVFTEQLDAIPFEHNYPIHELPLYSNSADWFIKAAWSLLTDWKNRRFSRLVREAVRGTHYDAVFCTTFSTFPLRAAQEIAREKNLPLLVDIRDLDEQVPDAQYQQHRGWWARPFRRWYRAINIRRRNRVLRTADAITTVSPWHVDFIKPLNPHVHLVYNGFDPEQFYPSEQVCDEFLVSYIGRMYDFQHPEQLFRILQSIPGVKLNIHTPDQQTIPITAVADEIRKSSIIIVLTDPSAHGMLTTKFFEALGCAKPVICYPSDQGLLAETIAYTHAGIATDNADDIRTFIAERYAEWQQQGFTRQDVCNSHFFSREEQSSILHQVLLSLLNKDTTDK